MEVLTQGHVDLPPLDQTSGVQDYFYNFSWMVVWVAYKIVFNLYRNVVHSLSHLQHWLSPAMPPVVEFQRPTGRLNARQLDVEGMSSWYVTCFGRYTHVDQLGRGVVHRSGQPSNRLTPTSLADLVEVVQDLGAKVQHAATYNLASGRLQGVCERVEVTNGSTFAFLCEMGRNRSVETQKFVEESGVSVNCLNPHGALGHDVLHDGDYHAYVRGLTYAKSFVFGSSRAEKHQRVGMGTSSMSRSDTRKWMDDNYYSQIADKRATVVAYDHGFHASIFRLACWAKSTGKRLDGVTIVPIKSDDPSYLGVGRSWGNFNSCVAELFNCHAV